MAPQHKTSAPEYKQEAVRRHKTTEPTAQLEESLQPPVPFVDSSPSAEHSVPSDSDDPRLLSPANLLALQGTIGNRAVRRLVQRKRMEEEIQLKPLSKASSGLVQRELITKSDEMPGKAKTGHGYDKIKKALDEYHSKGKRHLTDQLTYLNNLRVLCDEWLSSEGRKTKKGQFTGKDVERSAAVKKLQQDIRAELDRMQREGGEQATGTSTRELNDIGQSYAELIKIDDKTQYQEVGILNDRQYQALGLLQMHKPDYVKGAGFLDRDEAMRRAEHSTGKDWGPASSWTIRHKLQVAKIQVECGMTEGIGYKRYKGVTAKYSQNQQDKADAQAFLNQEDKGVWVKTLGTVNQENLVAAMGAQQAARLMQRNEAAMAILRRLFIVLQNLLEWRDNADAPTAKAWEGPVARALSHGGRVNIFLPPVGVKGDANAFWNWLMGGKEQAGWDWRFAATHGWQKREKGGEFKEAKLGSAKALHLTKYTTPHSGIHLPVGGLGTLNVNQETTLADGTNGHMYIRYDPPTAMDGGALLIGVEGSGPQKGDQYGKAHDTSGTSGEFSPTGGLKINKLGGEYGSMVVDLRNQNLSTMIPAFKQIEQGIDQIIAQGPEQKKQILEKLVGEKGGLG